MYQKLLSLAVICILSKGVYTATDTSYRLNTPIVPSTYDLLITPYFDTGDDKAFTFDGEVTIQFITTASTNQIQLNAVDLNFTATDIEVVDISKQNSLIKLNEINPLEINSHYEIASINLLEDLLPDTQYSVQIKYVGPIRDDLSGFYRSYYLENGMKKWVGATQMEAPHARKAFPCFDEPWFKATFTIHVDRPANYKKSLSNSKMEGSINLGNGYIRETFYPTPKMPTYLVAFLISENEAAQYSTNGSREFGIYTRPEAKNQTELAFNFGTTVINTLGAYYDIDYYSSDEYLKLDHVSIPDFRVGAMENWGLVKYREALLLYDPAHSGPLYKYRIAQVIAHESVHLYFGNLVTCHWWSDTWLNEAFASYFQDYITHFIEPELGSANQIVIGTMYVAYEADDSPSSSPMSNENVNSPDEINEQFGKISYQKGGSVVRMIHHLIEDDAFRFGIQTYLKNNSFGSGYPELMFAALEEGVARYNSFAYPNITITDVMRSWVTQAGYPSLQVDIDYVAETVSLSQRRFYIDNSYSSDEIYKIPITYTTAQYSNFMNTKPVFIMETKTHVMSIANISDHSWVLFNVQETGFYRVNYDEQSWKIIASALKGSAHKDIHYLNRAKIVNDLFAFLYADEIEFAILHDVLEFLSEETEYSVWYTALCGFDKLRNSYLGDTEALTIIDAYLLRQISFGVNRFGYAENSNDSFEDLRNRQQILDFACKLDHRGCVDHAVELFEDLKERSIEISPSLRPVVYATGLRYGNSEDYEFLWNRISTNNVANEITVIAEALGHTSDPEKIKTYLVSLSMDNSPIKRQDLTVPLISVLSNYSNLNIVMDELRNEFSLWNIIYTTMDTPLSLIASALRTESDFDEFETFLEECMQCTEDAKIVAIIALENAKKSKIWADNHRTVILETLTSKSNSDAVMPSLLMLALSFTVFYTFSV